jgi:hypothetical protein
MLPWLYFGCGPRDTGHYLFREDGEKLHAFGSSPLAYLRSMNWDGALAPQPERGDMLYKASLSRLGGWGYSALSWWDRSADTRGKSNSTILAPSIDIDPDEFWHEAIRRFPWVFERLPTPLKPLF